MAYSPTIWNNGDVITAEKLNKLEEAVHYEQEEMESQEKARVEAESIRDTQETARVKAETGRASAEKARETAETNRINAENKRQTDTAAAINNCNTATDRANKAAQDAEDVVAGKGFIASSEKGAAGGVATLDSTGKVPDTQIPDIPAGKVTEDASHRFATDVEKEKWNTDISELTPTFPQASTRANLTSGEKLKISLGKIMKWFADLKPHAFADPVNNLTGTDAAYPLAAPQGKILDGKITSLIQNTITKSMLSNQQVNSTDKVPTSALVYAMSQQITQLITNLNSKIKVVYEEIKYVQDENESWGEYTPPAGYVLISAHLNNAPSGKYLGIKLIKYSAGKYTICLNWAYTGSWSTQIILGKFIEGRNQWKK